MDSSGDQHLHIEHNIFKRRLDLQGNPIEEAKKEDIATSKTMPKKESVSIFARPTNQYNCYQTLTSPICYNRLRIRRQQQQQPQQNPKFQHAEIVTVLKSMKRIVVIRAKM